MLRLRGHPVRFREQDCNIEIKETLDRKTKQNPKKPCDIVANKSGIITKMAVKSGTPLVSVGDSVKSGTT